MELSDHVGGAASSCCSHLTCSVECASDGQQQVTVSNLLHVMMLPADCCVIISCTYSNHFNCLMTSEKSSQTEVLLVAWIHVFEGKIVLLTGQRNKLFLKEIQKSNGPETLTIIDVQGTDRNRSTSIIDNAGFTQALEAIKSAAGS